MKKHLLTLGLSAVTAASAFADGTIQFNIGALNQVTMFDGLNTQPVNFPFYVAVYWSPDASEWNGPVEPFGIGSGTTGLFSVDNATAYPITGTTAGQTVSMQIYAWQASYGQDPYQAWLAGSQTAATAIRQITLGAEVGPGTVIWQGTTGTNPNRFSPLQFGLARPAPLAVPEPTTLALGALGGLMLLFRCRNSNRRNP